MASQRTSLLLEGQYSNEVLFRQKLCQDISPSVRTNLSLSESVNCYLCICVCGLMMSSPGNETERWGCNDEGARWGQECAVCVRGRVAFKRGSVQLFQSLIN